MEYLHVLESSEEQELGNRTVIQAQVILNPSLGTEIAGISEIFPVLVWPFLI